MRVGIQSCAAEIPVQPKKMPKAQQRRPGARILRKWQVFAAEYRCISPLPIHWHMYVLSPAADENIVSLSLPEGANPPGQQLSMQLEQMK